MTILVLAALILAAALVLVRLAAGLERSRTRCAACGAAISPPWQALMIGRELYCDVDCWRTLPAAYRKAMPTQNLGHPWYQMRREDWKRVQ